MNDMGMDTPAHARRVRLDPGQGWFVAAFILCGVTLTPISFIVMLLSVQSLLAPSLHFWAWTVPVGTETGFIGLFCMDLLLEWKRRPLRLLRLAPWLFAVISLTLNVMAAGRSISGMLGHAVLPLLFFGYILVAESAVRRLTVTDEERAGEMAMADALAHARDLVRDRLGRLWRLRCPSLLRRQMRSGRATAAVRTAAENAARYGQHEALEAAVSAWVVGALISREKTAAAVETARRNITRQAAVTGEGEPPEPVRVSPQRPRKPSSPAGSNEAKRAKVRELLTEGELTQPQIAARAGVSLSTVERIKAQMPRQLHVARQA